MLATPVPVPTIGPTPPPGTLKGGDREAVEPASPGAETVTVTKTWVVDVTVTGRGQLAADSIGPPGWMEPGPPEPGPPEP